MSKQECKYLSDGRKVAIIGQLNNIESIVQEVFVTEAGDEIPSGERFTVKSLHDEPVLSYRDKQIKSAEDRLGRYEQAEADAEKKADTAMQGLKAIQSLLMKSQKLIDLLPESDLEAFTMFMTGTVEFLVIDDYTISPPVKMMDKIIQWDNYYGEQRFEDIKLLSVLGKSEGNLSYRINQYSDGSGGCGIKCYPFASMIDAISHIKDRAVELIENERLSVSSYKECIGMGIEFSKKQYAAYKKPISKKIKENIVNATKTLGKQQETIDGYNAQLAEL